MRILTQEAKPHTSSSSWYLLPKPNPQAALRLFCFPYAGGVAEIYHSWLSDLPDDVELVAIQYPGHLQDSKSRLYTDMERLVTDLLEELRPLLDKPYALFGHSMGALAAYTFTHTLLEQGLRLPEHLFVSARNPPQLPVVSPAIHRMSISEFIQILRAFKVLPDEVLMNPGLLNVILPILRADFQMIETWSYNPAVPLLPVPVHAFAGINDTLALPKHMAQWAQLTERSFKLITFPEQHYFLLNRDVRADLIGQIMKMIL